MAPTSVTPPASGPARLLWNLRRGRMQKTLALTAALSAPPLGFEMYLEHYKGSFGDPWMWSPILTSPLLGAAGLAGFPSPRAARTLLPAASALYALNGVIGTITHLRGVQRKPGGFHQATYNLVMGPPLLAPGSLILVGLIGTSPASWNPSADGARPQAGRSSPQPPTRQEGARSRAAAAAAARADATNARSLSRLRRSRAG